jgi:DNA polymerase-3 subunit delta'
MPEYLGKEGNKLLKLIEEPPANTLFILVAENESLILSTILSRCQLVKVPAIDAADVEAALVRRAGTAPDVAKRIANTSEGNYREALQLLQHADNDFTALLREWLNATIKYQPAAQAKRIEDLARLGREAQKQLLRFFQHLLELALRLRMLDEQNRQKLLSAMSESECDFAERLNKISTIEQQEAIVAELDNAAYYIERNANAKMLFHALTIKLFYILRNNVVVEI